MPVMLHTLGTPERRMLIEMLIGERAGETGLRVGGYFGRPGVAQRLCHLDMSRWLDDERIGFTQLGRHVAEALAERLVFTHAFDAC